MPQTNITTRHFDTFIERIVIALTEANPEKANEAANEIFAMINFYHVYPDVHQAEQIKSALDKANGNIDREYLKDIWNLYRGLMAQNNCPGIEPFKGRFLVNRPGLPPFLDGTYRFEGGSFDKLDKFVDDRYRITDELPNKGGTADVVFANDTQTGDEVALKFMTTKDLDRSQIAFLAPRFEQEFNVQRYLSNLSDQILAPIKFARHENMPVIVFERMEGLTLWKHIKHYKPSPNAVMRLLKQAASVLEFVHKNQVVHRDIKPNNFMVLNENQRVVLFDFTMCKVIVNPMDIALSKVKPDSWRYSSPEMKREPGNVDCSTDIYSFAVMAAECFLGKELGKENLLPLDKIRQLLTEAEIPNENQEVILASLRRDSMDRPQSMAIWQKI